MGTFKAWCLLLAAAALSACADSTPSIELSNDHPPVELNAFKHDQAELYVASGKIWSNHSIPICWEVGTGAALATKEGWVRDAVEKTWSYFADATFTGWGTCEGWGLGSKGIRITLEDSADDGHGPRVNALGDSLNGVKGGMVLNFTFQKWEPSCQQRLEYCIRSIAVHEFGHALGFSHEQNRDDRLPCDKDDQGEDGDVYFGAYDIDSVMNYCNPKWNNYGVLSKTDVEGVQAYYGVPPGLTAALTVTALSVL